MREEITRALGAVADVADSVRWSEGYETPGQIAADILRDTMSRVARDVLANAHPAAEAEHTASTDDGHDLGDACTCGHDFYRHRSGACFACSCPRFTSTPAVHTITAVPERARTVCACSGHVHVMGYNDLCCYPGCRCGTPVRAQAEHTSTPPSTDVPRACTVCLHGEHDQGKCGMHVYVDGVARPCPCLASRTVRSTRGPGCGHITCEGWAMCRDPKHTSTRPGISCTVCSHAPHGAGNCQHAVASGTCLCTGRASTPACTYCNHVHVGTAGDCDVQVGKYVCPCPFAGGRS